MDDAAYVSAMRDRDSFELRAPRSARRFPRREGRHTECTTNDDAVKRRTVVWADGRLEPIRS